MNDLPKISVLAPQTEPESAVASVVLRQKADLDVAPTISTRIASDQESPKPESSGKREPWAHYVNSMNGAYDIPKVAVADAPDAEPYSVPRIHAEKPPRRGTLNDLTSMLASDFNSIGWNDNERKLIGLCTSLPEEEVTVGRLAQEMGLKSHNVITGMINRIARKIDGLHNGTFAERLNAQTGAAPKTRSA